MCEREKKLEVIRSLTRLFDIAKFTTLALFSCHVKSSNYALIMNIKLRKQLTVTTNVDYNCMQKEIKSLNWVDL